MNDLNYYANFIRLQSDVLKFQKIFREDSVKLLSYDPNDKTDILNLIKRCPNPDCGLVWLKVQGCDGITYCGNRADYSDDRTIVKI
jgi:hypothetical protein